jgi:hypothetical protein
MVMVVVVVVVVMMRQSQSQPLRQVGGGGGYAHYTQIKCRLFVCLFAEAQLLLLGFRINGCERWYDVGSFVRSFVRSLQ